MDFAVNQLDAEAWDGFLRRCPEPHFMQSFGWGELQRASGWKPHYLSVTDGANLCGAVLLISRGIPGISKRLFYAPRGPVLKGSPAEADFLMLEAIRSYVRTEEGGFLRIDPYLREEAEGGQIFLDGGFKRLSRSWSFWNAPKFVFWLDLDREEEAVFGNMSRTARRDIRAGYKKGVEFTLGSESDLGEFYRLMVSMSSEKGIAVRSYDYFQRLYRTLKTSCNVGIFLAKHGSEVVATGMSVAFGKTGWLLYAASDSEHFHLRVNRNIQWEMIKWARQLGCRRYDFRGTATGDPPDPNDPGYGVYEFKNSFGPEFVRLAGYFDLIWHRPLYRLFRFGEEKALPLAYRMKVLMNGMRMGNG